MTNHSREHLGWRQLLVMAAVLLGATLLLVGLLPPQVAQGKEHQQEQNAAPQGQGNAQQQENAAPPQVAQGNEEQQQELLEQSAAPPAQGS